MKRFACECGQRIFFDNTECGVCGRVLGFDPCIMDMLSLSVREDGALVASAGGVYRHCFNYEKYKVCNWLLNESDGSQLCSGCRHTDVIPALDVPGNVMLWSKLEAAKRRLLYSLLSLGLANAAGGDGSLPRFRFLEDKSRNPAVFEEYVMTGHANGTVTINLAEADDVEREKARELMREDYRTLLGHFRHECGHYLFEQVVQNSGAIDEFRACFGDERADYAAAMADYYARSAPGDWHRAFVSAYATAHPHEDWAETFAHYLHIRDALETAKSAGLRRSQGGQQPGWILDWMELAVTLNELNRSLGAPDAYPFVLSAPIINKLRFIDRLVRRPA